TCHAQPTQRPAAPDAGMEGSPPPHEQLLWAVDGHAVTTMAWAAAGVRPAGLLGMDISSPTRAAATRAHRRRAASIVFRPHGQQTSQGQQHSRGQQLMQAAEDFG
ncbi:hypothetical protein Dimus_013836, partial [Dionaea muscipula]